MQTIDEIMDEAFEEEEADGLEKGGGSRKDDNSRGDMLMPLLPDGIGLDFEDTRLMLSRLHGTYLGKDEPIMMMVNFGNIFLSELEKLHKKHNKAVTRIMVEQSGKYIAAVAEKSGEFVAGVKESSEALGAALKESSVDAIRDIFNSHAKELNSNKLNARWCAAIMAVAALVNIAVTLLR